ncbi:hypothetical protein MSG28_011104 [Choristoneura fumiferana]|uniref:Uncharacterized protein n=1 Tax=Choristoneura fumiferana TaxID=7141 RepID=A0ACC0KQD6_CHOFU|nr:hypothetical protein MSG28_011104 [Choristoneura fumiferana]
MTRGNQRDLARAKNQKKQAEQAKKKAASEKGGMSLSERKHSEEKHCDEICTPVKKSNEECKVPNPHSAHVGTADQVFSFRTESPQRWGGPVCTCSSAAEWPSDTPLVRVSNASSCTCTSLHILGDAELMREKQRKKEEQEGAQKQVVN